MKILIAHHLEPMWDATMRNMRNISIDQMVERTAAWIEKEQPDRVIITQFELIRYHECYAPIFDHITPEFKEYGYGWDLCSFDLESLDSGIIEEVMGTKITQGGSHSEVVIVEDWMLALKGHEVYLCGAFDGECIEDMEVALEAADVDFSRVENLIV